MKNIFEKYCSRTAIIAAAGVCVFTSADAHAQSYTGQGRVAEVTALGLVGLNVFNTGNLPSAGGTLNTGNLAANVSVALPSATTAVVLNASSSFASTVGANGSVTSTAGLTNVSLLSLEQFNISVLAPTVTVGAITSSAYADKDATFGFSRITDLRVGSQVVNLATVSVNGQIYTAPNQNVTINGVQLAINEQTVNASGVLTVNALRVRASPAGIGVSDITLGTTRAGFSPAVVVVPEVGTLALALPALGMVGYGLRRRKIRRERGFAA